MMMDDKFGAQGIQVSPPYIGTLFNDSSKNGRAKTDSMNVAQPWHQVIRTSQPLSQNCWSLVLFDFRSFFYVLFLFLNRIFKSK
jgi:hypothetical protein